MAVQTGGAALPGGIIMQLGILKTQKEMIE